jgi:hypothetical protein
MDGSESLKQGILASLASLHGSNIVTAQGIRVVVVSHCSAGYHLRTHLDSRVLTLTHFALVLFGVDGVYTGEYILMQLMRIGVVKADEIKKMKSQFSRLDIHSTGKVDVHALRASGFLHPPMVCGMWVRGPLPESSLHDVQRAVPCTDMQFVFVCLFISLAAWLSRRMYFGEG